MDDLASAKVITFILTRDRAASTAWYADVLGLPVVAADDGFASVLDLHGTLLRITQIDITIEACYLQLTQLVLSFTHDVRHTLRCLQRSRAIRHNHIFSGNEHRYLTT